MAAAPVKVYGPPTHSSVSRVLACLLEKDVPFELRPIKGVRKDRDYFKIQPGGETVITDDSITLVESRAICRYICNKYANQGNEGLYGTNPLVKASIDQWLEAEGQSFFRPSSDLVFQLALGPKKNIKVDENLIRQTEAKLVKVLDVYDKRLGVSRYLAGDDFTLADLSHLPNMHCLVNLTDRGELFTSRKNVERWRGEISNRESWKKVLKLQIQLLKKALKSS